MPEIDVRKLRNRLGLTQDEFSRRFGVDVATLRKWERRIRTPTGPARTLLIVIDSDPKLVERALANLRAA